MTCVCLIWRNDQRVSSRRAGCNLSRLRLDRPERGEHLKINNTVKFYHCNGKHVCRIPPNIIAHSYGLNEFCFYISITDLSQTNENGKHAFIYAYTVGNKTLYKFKNLLKIEFKVMKKINID